MGHCKSKNMTGTAAAACRTAALLPVFVMTATVVGAFCHFVTALAPLATITLTLWSAASVCLCLYAITQPRSRKPALIMAEMLSAADRRDLEQIQHRMDGALASVLSDESAPPMAVPRMAPPRILLVDDNPMNRQLALLRLRTLGYAVDGVADGESALQAVRKAEYGLVLMDCQMPQMDGFETTRRIRRAERGGDRHLPVIAWTCLDRDPQRCLAAGMDDYLAKPLDDGQLEQMLAQWLPL